MIPAIHNWPTNAALIADVARLYLKPEDRILDATFGRGRWWTDYQPVSLTTNDLDKSADSHFHLDFRRMSFHDGQFDVVAFDPPYKLNGTPTLGDFDDRYGIAQPANWRERVDVMIDGLVECLRVADRLVLAKCQDQVCSGRVRWQTFELITTAINHGARLIDQFTMLGGTREQPPNVRQVHARGRGSTLLVFGK